MTFWASYGMPVGFVLVITVLVPLALVAFGLIRDRANLLPFGFGALAFAVSQLVLRLPLLALVGSWFTAPAAQLSVGYAAYVAAISFSAGLFEEWGRFFFLKLLSRREKLDGYDALAFGLGHASCEALVLVGASYLVLLCTPLGQLTLSQSAPADITIAGMERALTYFIHVGLTFLVFSAVIHNRRRKVWGAVALHGIVNFFAVVLSSVFSGNIWPAECWMFFCAIAAGLYVLLRLPDYLPGHPKA
ncbi:YhfC family glutamic-type intramembrane protease [Luoshenia tenuis]|uniref:YhfC family glutamic-type intramembrane protease n=1 Tax=Luoshenia tenuis TaxID=2763654 RepID=UPI003D8BF04B